ncbi:MAG: MATE family efflux transporter [Segniliparus sp.]|uniref:MATE family efflux transporter n=1 Tax=Segniliparus sp. TaxID=2804064 RepID=UPI003F392DDB
MVEAPVTARRIWSLVLPAVGVLAAEPLYVLWDTAVVGRLGAEALAGLAVGALVLNQAGSQFVFLSYGTTGRAARKHGAGDREGVVAEGVQATWIAAVLGVLFAVVGLLVADPLAAALAGSPQIADEAAAWLRVALWGAPLILVQMAGNGWMRGLQDIRRPLWFVVVGFSLSAALTATLTLGLFGAPRMGLVGSAVANLVGQAVSAALFVAALVRERPSWRPQWPVIRAQLALAREFLLRSIAFQACFVSAGAVAARFGAASLAGHQILLSLWTFAALVLDAVAIAAQSLVGSALGAGRADEAKALAWRLTRWSAGLGAGGAVLLICGHSFVPRLFTTDRAVLASLAVPWWLFVGLTVLGGVVFAQDGVLMGSGDVRFLRRVTMAGALCGFLPLVWASLFFGWGLAGVWTGLAVFVALRMLAGLWRVRSGSWAVTGSFGAPRVGDPVT